MLTKVIGCNSIKNYNHNSGSMPSGFSEEYFYVFTIQVNAKHVTSGVGPFLATE